MKFYINKYPIIKLHNYNADENEVLPEGLAFTISGISNMGYTLKPVKEIKYEKTEARPILEFSPEMLRDAFTEVDYLPE